MLHSLKDLDGYRLVAADGDAGSVRGACFDDQSWLVHHLLVDLTAEAETPARVHIDRAGVTGLDARRRRIDTGRTRRQLLAAGDAVWAASAPPHIPAAADSRLRHSVATFGCQVAARDADVGHVHDLLFDPVTWQIHLMVLDTHHRLPQRLLVVPPQWVEAVLCNERWAAIKLPRKALERCPPYEPQNHIDRDGALLIQRHFESSMH